MGILDKLGARRTYKTIGDIDKPVTRSIKSNTDIDEMLRAAGNAPFHYACDRAHKVQLASSVPWRAYKLDAHVTNRLAEFLIQNGDVTKVPNMLCAAEYLIQVTWLPDEGTIVNRDAGKDEEVFKGTMRNMEHLAAASAFVQSLLLAGEGQGFKTYWSSGGALKSDAVFEYLDIPPNQILLGSVFLYPSQNHDAEIKPGALKDARGSVDDWSRWCNHDG